MLKYAQAVTLTVLLLALGSYFHQVPTVHAGTRTSAITSALNWLRANQQTDGSYGAYSELGTAPAANALWIGSQDSTNVTRAYRFLRNQVQNSTTWFWGNQGSPAEADAPGEILYSFVASQHLQMLSLPLVVPRLLGLQQKNGGFRGYVDPSLGQVTSSVDTAMALLGLIGAKSIPAVNQTSAVNYLLSLQKNDGSFNLTRTVGSTALYSLGPEPIAITALVSFALRNAGFTVNDPHVVSALNYLKNAFAASFSGHVYAAALSALVFTLYYQPTQAASAVSFVLSQQDTTGGFRDVIRSSTGDNPIDTGWATLALELGGLFGDLNLDGVVNIADLSMVGADFGAVAGTSNYTSQADANADGVIDIRDLVIVAVRFGTTANSL